MGMYYHRDGTEADSYVGSWDETDPDCKRVASYKSKRGDVSTVFLSMDHGWDNEPPLIFETMVFGGLFADEQERYHTEAEALVGHEKWVAIVKRRHPWIWLSRKVRAFKDA